MAAHLSAGGRAGGRRGGGRGVSAPPFSASSCRKSAAVVDVDIISGCELFVVTRVQEMHFYEERNWVWSLFFFNCRRILYSL